MGLSQGKRIAVIGAGWAGLCAAIEASQTHHQVTVLEASDHLGGRARGVSHTLPNGQIVQLDNGQHILIGAYRQTLALLDLLGLSRRELFHQSPLSLVYPDGQGLTLPNWPSPVDALYGVLRTSAWTWRERWSLLRTMLSWQQSGFQCEPLVSVSDLCHNLAPRVFKSLIEPLCVSALNTPAAAASARVFLRVLQDSLLGPRGSSHLLLPSCDLGSILPQPAAAWLARQGAQVLTHHRAQTLSRTDKGWSVDGQAFDQVILATSASHACQLLEASAPALSEADQAQLAPWLRHARTLQFEPITTVYAWAQGARLQQPMLALHTDAKNAPAQFVFDRGQLKGPEGLLAFVVSASRGSRRELEGQVMGQAKSQLDLDLLPVLTLVEKQATFACTPGLIRPGTQILSGLVACGDYVAGPYPATLEGAIRSARHAVALLTSKDR